MTSRGARRGPGPRNRRAPARAAVLPFPGVRLGPGIRRLLPTRRSLATGLALLVAAGSAYAGARESSVFAVDAVRVEGAPPDVERQVRRALAPALGRSLLDLRFDDLRREVAAVPAVASVALDRAFPHTLRVSVVPEAPLAVARRGTKAWLVAASGRVVSELERGARPALPRIWLKRGARLVPGGRIAGRPARAVTALAAFEDAGLAARAAAARAGADEVTIVLRDGVELRLGDTAELGLKLAVAGRILPSVAPPLPGETVYLDVSVPERPVSGESQVEDRG